MGKQTKSSVLMLEDPEDAALSDKEGAANVSPVLSTAAQSAPAVSAKAAARGARGTKPVELTGSPVSILLRRGSRSPYRYVRIGTSQREPTEQELRDAFPQLSAAGGVVKLTCPEGGRRWLFLAADVSPDVALAARGAGIEPTDEADGDDLSDDDDLTVSRSLPAPHYPAAPYHYPWPAPPAPAPAPATSGVDVVGLIAALSPIVAPIVQSLVERQSGIGQLGELVGALASIRDLASSFGPAGGDDGTTGLIAALAPALLGASGSALATPPAVQHAPTPPAAARLGELLSSSGVDLASVVRVLEAVPPEQRAATVREITATIARGAS